MKAQQGHDADYWTFVTACDYMASQITADGGPHVKFQTSALGSGGGGSKPSNNQNGRIHNGYYTNEDWFALSREERDQVFDLRGSKKSGGGKGKNSYKGKSKEAHPSRKLKSLERIIKRRDKTISGLRRAPEEEETSGSEESADLDHAGNNFGGKAEKSRPKKKQKKK
jgi:hypothetical protein